MTGSYSKRKRKKNEKIEMLDATDLAEAARAEEALFFDAAPQTTCEDAVDEAAADGATASSGLVELRVGAVSIARAAASVRLEREREKESKRAREYERSSALW